MNQPPKPASRATPPGASQPIDRAIPSGWLSALWTSLVKPDTAGSAGTANRIDITRWLALAEARGPTPVRGPLRHDLLVRAGGSHGAAGRHGLNVFSRDERQDAQVLELMRAQARRWGCLPAIEALLAQLPAGLRYHGGFVCGAGGEALKLYLAADEQQPARHVIEQAMAALGMARNTEAIALGLDLGPAGWSRARSYHVWDSHFMAAGSCGWDAAEHWQALNAEGIAHRVLAQLDGKHAPDGLDKRSYDVIFTPGATLDGLFAVASAITALDPRCVPQYQQQQLRRLDRRLRAQGLALRPAAYEIDVFADGRRATDTLLTIGVIEPDSAERQA